MSTDVDGISSERRVSFSASTTIIMPHEDDSTSAAPSSPRSSDSGLLVNIAESHLDTHIDKVPKAEVDPEHVRELPTTVEAPMVAEGDEERPVEPDVEDLGWSKDPKIPIPVLHGMTNEELWVLVRRFNKSIYHVRSIDKPPGILDLYTASDEEFFPDKMRSTIERLYITVFLGFMGAVTHVARIRTWNERNRTAGFCAAYFLAWYLNLLMPLLIGTTITLMVHPPTRRTLFPSAPLALHSATTGKQTVPHEGHLGSDDTITGAAEVYKGQAAEQEASNFVTGFTSIAVGSAIGQGAPSAASSVHEDDDLDGEHAHLGQKIDKATTDGDVGSSVIPDPTSMITGAAVAQDNASGVGDAKTPDKTKKRVETAMWEQAGPVMHAIGIIADTWERFGNAFSPIPPFKQNAARLRIAATFVPVFFLSLVVTENVLYKTMTFAVGIGMFGQPLFDRMDPTKFTTFLDQHYPKWRDMLDIRNTLLYGVPTNAQLTITLLRIGEANKSPLPPPPPPGTVVPQTPVQEEGVEADPVASTQSTPPQKKSSKFLGFIKGTTKAGVKSTIGMDHIKSAIPGRITEQSKLRRGVVGATSTATESDGPTTFEGRLHGKKGYIVISSAATPPCVSFVKNFYGEKATMDGLKPAPEPVFTIAVDDIADMKKIGGYGWKGKAVVGWSLGREVVDGIEITRKNEAPGGGKKEILTAIPRRDEVFNRILAISSKKYWESV